MSLLSELRARGVTLFVRDGQLRYTPRVAMTPELLARVAAEKAVLVAALTKREPLDPSYWDTVGYETAPLTPTSDIERCYACHGTTWWRLPGGEWFCHTCASPVTGIGEIEVRDV